MSGDSGSAKPIRADLFVDELIAEARAFVERGNGMNWQRMVSTLADALEDAEESREAAAEAAKHWREKVRRDAVDGLREFDDLVERIDDLERQVAILQRTAEES